MRGNGGRTVAASPVMSYGSVSRCQAPRSGLPPGRCCRPKCRLRRFYPKEPPGTTPPPKASANMSSGGDENRGNCRGGVWRRGGCFLCKVPVVFLGGFFFCSDREAAERLAVKLFREEGRKKKNPTFTREIRCEIQTREDSPSHLSISASVPNVSCHGLGTLRRHQLSSVPPPPKKALHNKGLALNYTARRGCHSLRAL